MKIYVVNSGYFKLDGGAMFGVVPKSIWQKTNPADGNNMCNWAMRCLLVEDGNRLVLIDNGIGDKQDDKFLSHYYLHGNDSLDKSLANHGFTPNDITDVFLTHLHFDHCGGSIKWNKNRTSFEAVFPNAVYWTNKAHWKWATEPNAREKASFLKENIIPMQELGVLKFIEDEEFSVFKHFTVNGHTDAMMLPILEYQNKKIIYCADLIPSAGHVPLPYVMGYDTRPLLTLEEKVRVLNQALEEKYILFFEHDSVNECCTLMNTEKGARVDKAYSFAEIFG